MEKEFLINGKIGRLSDEDSFDYIWYGNNTFIKIFYSMENNLNLNRVSKLLFNWFEEAIERGSFELIVIVPFYDWAEALRSWLKTVNSNQILIFSYYVEDWNKLRSYLDDGINPEWNSNTGQNPQIIKYNEGKKTFSGKNFDLIKEKRKFQSNLDSLLASRNNISKNLTTSVMNLQGKDNDKSVIQQKWIKEIISRYKNKFSSKIMKRFSDDYPSLTELSEELSCTIQNVENEMKGIRRYLKSVEIHDLYDPLTYRQRYFGWKNEDLGHNLMQKEIIKVLNDKNIEFNTFFLSNDKSAVIIHKKILIFTIFEESELSEFMKILESKRDFEKYDRIILIIHTIESKHFCEKKIKRNHSERKFELYLYDWAALGPFIRELM